jgi:hypothetical protein
VQSPCRLPQKVGLARQQPVGPLYTKAGQRGNPPSAVRLVAFRGAPSNRFNPRDIPAVSRSRNAPLDNSRYNTYYPFDAFRRLHDFHPQKQ